MKIKDIRASIHTISITVPLIEKKIEGYGRAEQRNFIFCEVETDDGIVGYGLTGHFLAEAVVAALEKHFLPTVRDMDPRDTEAIHARVAAELNPRAMSGVVSMALSLLDMALWDIAGKHAGRTVAQLGTQLFDVTQLDVGADGLDPGPVRRGALFLVAPAPEDLGTLPLGVGR